MTRKSIQAPFSGSLRIWCQFSQVNVFLGPYNTSIADLSVGLRDVVVDCIELVEDAVVGQLLLPIHTGLTNHLACLGPLGDMLEALRVVVHRNGTRFVHNQVTFINLILYVLMKVVRVLKLLAHAQVLLLELLEPGQLPLDLCIHRRILMLFFFNLGLRPSPLGVGLHHVLARTLATADVGTGIEDGQDIWIHLYDLIILFKYHLISQSHLLGDPIRKGLPDNGVDYVHYVLTRKFVDFALNR